MHRERIAETSVGELSGEAIAATAGRVDDYELPDGSTLSGATMLVCFLADRKDTRVGKGSQIDAGGGIWTVTGVHLADGVEGWVDLESSGLRDITLVSPADLDFLFEEECDDFYGRSGWDGSTDMRLGSLAVGLQCTECPTKMWVIDGRIQRAFEGGAPEFTPGRRA